jgi:adenine-specific DNA-methyltransferase
MEYSYSDLSHQLTNRISKQEKKDNGIFFTPPKTIQKNLNFLRPFMKKIKRVLEPSCGSCEYIIQINELFDRDVDITGIESNNLIYDSIIHLESDNIQIYNEDFLLFNNNQKYDLIIGNPPYFVIKKKDTDPIYYNYFNGRPNIFIIFILKSLELLENDGILSFILPTNFLNCLFYDKTRKYISENYAILNIYYNNDSYIETKQDTVCVILQNKNPVNHDNDRYILNINNYTIFGEKDNISKLKELYENSYTLSQKGFCVYVGSVIWNQCKDILTNDESQTVLIYSSDIKNNNVQIQNYQNKDKKNYIFKKGSKEKILVVNRGYGVGNYNLSYALIDGEYEYLTENHLICIKDTKNNLSFSYDKIIKSFENKKTKQFIKLYFGNNAINTKELGEIFPIYEDI